MYFLKEVDISGMMLALSVVILMSTIRDTMSGGGGKHCRCYKNFFLVLRHLLLFKD